MNEPRRFLRAQDVAARVPVSAVWELTLACDLRCRHCGSRAGHRRPRELDLAECRSVIQQLAQLGTREIGLIGGEAYLRPDWLEIIRAIREAGIDCSLQSGARNLTRERIEAAAAAGLQGLGVSLDGLANVHDRLRGVEGSFAAAIEALEHARACGLVTSVNTQLFRASVPCLPQLLDEILRLGVTAWLVGLTVPMGRAADNDELLLQPYDLLELFPLLAELHERGLRHGLVLQPANNVGYFGPYEAGLRRSDHAEVHFSGCDAGRNLIGLEADGSVKGCPGLSPEYVAGNVRDQPIAELWRKRAELDFMQRASVDDLWGYCRICYFAEVCQGGCTWMAHSLFGRRGNNPYCHYRALELSARGLRERVTKRRPAPGAPFDHGEFELVLERLDSGEAPRPARHALRVVP